MPDFRRLLLFIMILWLGGCMSLSTTRQEETPAKSIRILALGDSYTIGEGVETEARWPMQLAERLRTEGLTVAEPELIARTGWTTDELAEAIARQDPEGPYQLVMLLIGVNNQYRGNPIAEYRAEFEALLITAIHLAGDETARVVVLSIPDWGATPFAQGQDQARIRGEIEAFNAENRQASERAGVHYVDVTQLSRLAQANPALLASDGLHPSGEMYAAWVELLLPVTRSALGIRE
jgi:lysophospholipase L1-like esterase